MFTNQQIASALLIFLLRRTLKQHTIYGAVITLLLSLTVNGLILSIALVSILVASWSGKIVDEHSLWRRLSGWIVVGLIKLGGLALLTKS